MIDWLIEDWQANTLDYHTTNVQCIVPKVLHKCQQYRPPHTNLFVREKFHHHLNNFQRRISKRQNDQHLWSSQTLVSKTATKISLRNRNFYVKILKCRPFKSMQKPVNEANAIPSLLELDCKMQNVYYWSHYFYRWICNASQ